MNSRRITASIIIDCPIEDVWGILTDYNNLSKHVPNLVKSYVIPNSPGTDPNGIRLFQEGAQKIIGFDFRASLTMDMTEEYSDENRSMQQRILRFKLAESSMFASFDGSWMLKFHSRSRKFDPITGEYISFYKTLLTYSVFIKPKGIVPVIALEWRIREDIPPNLKGLKSASENYYVSKQIFQDEQQSINNSNNNSNNNAVKNDVLMLFQSPTLASSSTINKKKNKRSWEEDETLGK